MGNMKMNNQVVSFTKDETIYDIAKRNGIFIPTFCHDERLKPDGSCRMCIVEDEKSHKLITSCNTIVSEQMEISTNSNLVQSTRKELLELLWSSHPNDCVVCDVNGDCKLQDYMVLYQVSPSRKFEYHQRKFAIDSSNKFFYIDPEKCILCGKCVRICRDLQGVEALCYDQRGHNTAVSFAFNQGMEYSNCVSCGNCVTECPTGALVEKRHSIFKPSETTITTTTCPYCGVGCQLNLFIKDNTIVKVEGAKSIPNDGLLCVKGKFAYRFVNHKNRLKQPLIKVDGEFHETTWEHAYNVIISKIIETKTKFGSNSFAGMASAKCTNEENYLFQKFMRAFIGTNNVDHCARLCHASTVSGLATTLGSGAMTNSIEEVKNNDVIFVIGSNTTETHPVIGSYMKQAVANGAKLIVAEPRKIDLAEHADVFIQIEPGTNVALLNGMMNVIYHEQLFDSNFIQNRTESFDDFVTAIRDFTPKKAASICGCHEQDIIDAARMYATGSRSAIYYAMGITQHSNGTNHVKSIANLALLCGNVGKEFSGINPLRGQNNVQGACDMGALPNNFPGYQKVYDKQIHAKFEEAWNVSLSSDVGLSIPHMLNGAFNQTIQFMYIMGENPIVSDPDTTHVKQALSNLNFLVVQDIFLTETAEFADIVLPASSFAEKTGTFTNTERRVQLLRQAIQPIGQSKPDGEIIQELMSLLKPNYEIQTPEEVMQEISSLTPIYHGVTHHRLDPVGLQWPVKDLSHKGTKYLHKDQFSRGLATFTPIQYKGSVEQPDKEYPLILTTGRVLYHFHTITMTGKNDEINEIVPVNFIEIHPDTAKDYQLTHHDSVIVYSRRGETKAQVHITEKMSQGVIFMPFHFADGANMLTNTALDETCHIPELKVCAVQIRGVEGG